MTREQIVSAAIFAIAIILSITTTSTTFAAESDSTAWEYTSTHTNTQKGIPVFNYRDKSQTRESAIYPQYDGYGPDTSTYECETEITDKGIPVFNHTTKVVRRERGTGGYGPYDYYQPVWGYADPSFRGLTPARSERFTGTSFVPEKYRNLPKSALFPVYCSAFKQGQYDVTFRENLTGYEFTTPLIRGCSWRNGDGTFVWLPMGDYAYKCYDGQGWIALMVDPSQTGYKAANNGALVAGIITYENANAGDCVDPYTVQQAYPSPRFGNEINRYRYVNGQYYPVRRSWWNRLWYGSYPVGPGCGR